MLRVERMFLPVGMPSLVLRSVEVFVAGALALQVLLACRFALQLTGVSGALPQAIAAWTDWAISPFGLLISNRALAHGVLELTTLLAMAVVLDLTFVVLSVLRLVAARKTLSVHRR